MHLRQDPPVERASVEGPDAVEGLRELGYRIGDKIMLFGLKRDEFRFLNGCSGRVIGYRTGADDNPQVMVVLTSRRSDQAFALKPQNMCHLNDDVSTPSKPLACTSSLASKSIKLFTALIILTTCTLIALRRTDDTSNPRLPRLTTNNIPATWGSGISWLTEATREVYENAAERLSDMIAVETEAMTVRDEHSNAREIFYELNKARIDETLIPFSSCRWVPTTLCSPYGSVMSRWGKICQTRVPMTSSGFCVCTNGRFYGKGCGGLTPRTFTCMEVCQRIEGASLEKPLFPTKSELVSKFNSSSRHNESGVVVMTTLLDQPHMVLRSVISFEARANKFSNLPYVIFIPPNQKISPDFVASVKAAARTTVSFVTVSPTLWNHKNTSAERSLLEDMTAGMIEERLLNRFMLLNMHNHPALLAYDFYWRLDEASMLMCDLPYNPLRLLAVEGKSFGFSMASVVSHNGVSQILSVLREFRKDSDAAAMKAFLGTKGEHKICGANTAFEVGSLSWLRTPRYTTVSRQLDDALYFLKTVVPDSITRTTLAAMSLRFSDFYYFESVAVASAADLYHIPSDPAFCEGELLPNKSHHLYNDHTHPCTRPHVAQFGKH